MLVYGDLERDEDAAMVGAVIERRLNRCRDLEAGLARHQQLVAAFIRAGELVQGVVDAEFYNTGSDDIGPLQQAGTDLLRVLADAIATSWDSDFTDYACRGWGEHLALLSAARPITTRQAEGYAFYALYPETYLMAARRSGLGPETTVIGIRSIGASLAGMVGSALNAPAVYTVRPIGHPFDRRLGVSDRLAERLGHVRGDVAVVDEGPGLSGSSFNCVADWLVAHGVPERSIHFFPSHGGDLGMAARADHRQRWSAARKHLCSFETAIPRSARPAHRLEQWVSGAVGPLEDGLMDLSGGAWRAVRTAPAPLPADPGMEKRKYLATTGQRRWLAKFAGIGPAGEDRLALATRLGDAGFAPRPVGLQHGFIVTPWVEDERASDEAVPVDHLAAYLAFRAGIPADRAGADLDQLFSMASYNIGQILGDTVENAVRSQLGNAARFERVPCCSDNRMHAWEWIRSGDKWLKLDALDHHAAHDLVGCQDIAWDIAGAAVELGLSAGARDHLAAAVSTRIHRSLLADFVAVNELCYLGFQLGLWSMARERAGASERGSIERQLRRYIEHPALRSIAGECAGRHPLGRERALPTPNNDGCTQFICCGAMSCQAQEPW